MSTLAHTTTFQTEICCSCGVAFALDSDYMRRRRNDHAWFYCPNGHKQHYTGKTDADIERERAEQAERRLANAREDTRIARAEQVTTRRQLSAARGQLTKTKNRVAKGVCPCCNRSFANVARHMAGQHPNYASKEHGDA